MEFRRIFLILLSQALMLFALGCADSAKDDPFIAGKAFPQDHETHVDLIQIAMSALPGVHMGPARQALIDQKDQMIQGKKISALCRYDQAEDDEGTRQEILGGKNCPIKIEVENFGQTVDIENGVVRFQENVMYVRNATTQRRRQGLEVHSTFEFHLDFLAEQVTPIKILVSAKAKHLRRGVLQLQSVMTFSKTNSDEKILTSTISNELYTSVVEIDFGKNISRIDGVETRAFQDPRAKLYTNTPDLSKAH